MDLTKLKGEILERAALVPFVLLGTLVIKLSIGSVFELSSDLSFKALALVGFLAILEIIGLLFAGYALSALIGFPLVCVIEKVTRRSVLSVTNRNHLASMFRISLIVFGVPVGLIVWLKLMLS